MKNLRILFGALVALMMSTGLVSCSDDDDNGGGSGGNDPQESVKFDLYVCAVKHGGMSQNKNGTFVRSVDALTADQPMVEFTGKGLEITQSYTMESITKGKYYYQVPQSPADRFSKFQILTDANGDEYVETVAEVPFLNNTYYARKYTHAWTDDQTLVVVGTDADHKIVYWSKLKDTETSLAIEAEGTLDIPIPEPYTAISTSGILTYRESDGKLYYFYNAKGAPGMSVSANSVLYTAIINPADMSVVSVTPVDGALAEETAGSAYGELMQNTVMHDEEGNLYLACLKTIDGAECGSLIRMKAGQTEFEPGYNAFPNPEGKLLTVQYLGGDKALAYSRDNSLGTKIDSESHFYTIIDLKNSTRERVAYNGEPLRYCSGRFSQRSAVYDGKAYIGVTEGAGADDYPCVYIYDIKTGEMEQGVKLSKGFCFDIIRVMAE